MKLNPIHRHFFLSAILLGATAATALGDSPAWRLLPAATVSGSGIFLNEIVENPPETLPHLRLATAPAAGQTATLTRSQINELLRQQSAGLLTTNWMGATQIKISRRTRSLAEAEVLDLLTTALQRDFVKDKGELEIRPSRPWAVTAISDEVFTVKILDVPIAGVTPSFIIHFELRAGQELLGNWQMPVQAHVWREIIVAGSPLHRGQLLKDADLSRERRDALTLRDSLTSVPPDDALLEIAENIPTGQPLTLHSVRARPIVRRGKVADAIIQEGAMMITVKVEVLEDGVSGQTVRVRNLKSRREFRGKVQNEETILVSL